jgi:nucleoside-diphosphate-sugar epimerase
MSTREVLGPIYTEADVVQVDGDYRPKFLVNEGAPYSPGNFYGKSKIMAEFISESHPKSSVIRLTTCYTDYDHPGGNWMVALVKAAVNGRPVSLTRGGRQFRDPLHIDDLGRLMEAIHSSNAWGEKFHAGGGDANMISLLEFVLTANPGVKVEQAPGGDFGFAFDNSKASKMTGWSPRILVRERIPVLVENIRAGNSWPASGKPGVNPR